MNRVSTHKENTMEFLKFGDKYINPEAIASVQFHEVEGQRWADVIYRIAGQHRYSDIMGDYVRLEGEHADALRRWLDAHEAGENTQQVIPRDLTPEETEELFKRAAKAPWRDGDVFAVQPGAWVISSPRPENDSHETEILQLYNNLKTPKPSESIYDWMQRVDSALMRLNKDATQ